MPSMSRMISWSVKVVMSVFSSITRGAASGAASAAPEGLLLACGGAWVGCAESFEESWVMLNCGRQAAEKNELRGAILCLMC
jgi:hypothetical protein